MAEFGEKLAEQALNQKTKGQRTLVTSMLFALGSCNPASFSGIGRGIAPDPVEPRACLNCGANHTVKDRSFCSGDCCNQYRNKKKINHKSMTHSPAAKSVLK